MSFKELNASASLKKKEDINITKICKGLVVVLLLSILAVFACSIIVPEIYLSPTNAAAELLQKAEEGVTTAQILSVAFMLLPLALMSIFGASILKNRKTRLNMAFVIPVIVLGVFCFIMAVVQLVTGSGYQCIAYLIFEIFAMLTLMVFNLIENRTRINLKGAARRAGLVGVCIAIIAMSFSSVLRSDDTANDSPTEINQTEQKN